MTETQEKKQEHFWLDGAVALADLPEIRKGLTTLLKQDARLRAVHAARGLLPWKKQPAGFGGLVQIIVSQQISTVAATRLIARLCAALPDLTPRALLTTDDPALRALGLSGQKVAACRALAEKISDKSFDPAWVEDMENDAAISALTALRGIGPWSAEMYLMFCLGRPDVWPAGDMGVQKGVEAICGLPARPTAAQTRTLGADWAPYRTAACLIAWRAG